MAFPVHRMDDAEVAAYLAQVRHAIVATQRSDGPPQLSAVWFVYSGDQLHFTMGRHSAKYRNLRRDPRIAVCVDAGHPDARSVNLYGTATLDESGSAHVEALHRQIARRYASSEADAERYLQLAEAEGPVVLVSVTPKRVVALDYN